MEFIPQVVVNGISLSLSYVLVALGLTLVYGLMAILNFAHGAVYMVAAYVLYTCIRLLGLNYPFSVFISILATGGLGLLIERIVIRPVRTIPLSPFLACMGAAMILEHAALLVFGPLEKSIDRPFKGVMTWLGMSVSVERVMVILVASLAALGFYLFLTKAKQGQAMRAVGQNAEAAALHGIKPLRMFALSMFFGSALAAVGAVLMAPISSISPNMGFTPMFKGFIIIILGGVGSIPGCFAAAFIVGFIDSLGATFLGWEVASIIGFVLLMIMLIVRPRGLVPGV